MDTKQIEDLKGDPENPRIISKHDGAALAESMKKFGDLSGIVFNVRTQQLVGGHQRLEILNKVLVGAKSVVITQKFQDADGNLLPDKVGTVALGYVVYNDVQYSYREVDWEQGWQRSANIAANRIQGEFDIDQLAKITYEISQLENGADLLTMTGQTTREVKALLKNVGVEDPEEQPAETKEEPEKLEFALTREQRQLILETLEHIKSHRDLQAVATASQNGAALFVICQDYLAVQPAEETPVEPANELTDVPQ